jgi:hypothetical protein
MRVSLRRSVVCAAGHTFLHELSPARTACGVRFLARRAFPALRSRCPAARCRTEAGPVTRSFSFFGPVLHESREAVIGVLPVPGRRKYVRARERGGSRGGRLAQGGASTAREMDRSRKWITAAMCYAAAVPSRAAQVCSTLDVLGFTSNGFARDAGVRKTQASNASFLQAIAMCTACTRRDGRPSASRLAPAAGPQSVTLVVRMIRHPSPPQRHTVHAVLHWLVE